jgi:RNA 2',3'-cyclic 3'-phosphodiesterase
VRPARCNAAGMARLFLAVWPTASVIERLRAVPTAFHPGVRWVPPENWHVTLRFFGDAEPAAVTARLAGRLGSLPSATAVFGPAVQRLGRRAFVVPVGGLEELASAVGVATADVGAPVGRRPFNGHLTLARLRRGTVADVPAVSIAAAQRVTDVVLVQSDLTPVGATYRVIGRWAMAS